MRIALDAMGTDEYPGPDVEGGLMAARDWGDHILFVGREDVIRRELVRHDTEGLALEVVHASQVIEMGDEPSWAAREKKNSSMHVGMNLVRDNRADAFVTAGNTGGVLAVATLHSLRRIRGVKRPVLAVIIPLPAGRIIALDIGANADCKPDHLVQFALMGSVYAQAVLGRSNPRVALLSNGEEPGKGNDLVKRTSKLLADTPLNFIGNMEPKDVATVQTDVIVTDGFSGNIFIKTMEATAKMLTDLIRDEIKANPVTSIGGLLAKPAFRRVARRVDPFEVGGGPLLGVNGLVIIAHGRSNARAIRSAIGQARRAVEGGVLEAIRSGLAAV
ncbi:MAG: phosphate acyltransferase PlsX [Anaerolineales bacterium]|nr:MAG: phosphate acyltransferase PlsX [Anaerolineales bacterium]